MPLPLALGLVGAGAGAGILGGMLGGDQEQNTYRRDIQNTKKIAKISADQTTVSPQISDQLDYSPQIQIGSPSGSIASKKQQQQSPTQETSPTLTTPITQKDDLKTGDQSPSQGTDMTKMLAIGGALAGATYIVNEKVN